MIKTSLRLIGDIGEDCAVNYLKGKGFIIIERNYLRKWGEIDIVAQKQHILYFIEVKTRALNFYINGPEWYRPEDNLHQRKLSRLKRAIQTYLLEHNKSIEEEWEFSAITVILKRKSRELYKIEHLENLII
jgi:putative endonuclease